MRDVKGNGHDRGGGPDPKIASLDEVRRRAAEKARLAAAGSGKAPPQAPRSARDWLVGGILVAMALGMLWTFVAPLFRLAGRG